MVDRRRKLFSREPVRHGSFAMIQPSRAKISTAALHTVSDGVKARNMLDGWAQEAYTYADEIGEVGFVANLSANSGAQCLLPVQQYDPETRSWAACEDERPLRVMAAFQGPQGGQAELIRRGFLHLGIAGESILLGTPTEENGVPTGLFWEFLSSEELRVTTGQRPSRKRDGAGADEYLTEDHYTARLWRSHPRYSDLADSPMRRVLGICHEILTLTQMVSAIAQSRLSAGILYVPEELDFEDDGTGDELAADEADGDETASKFMLRLETHMKAPVEDRTSASSLVPLILRGPGELKDQIGLVDIARNLDTWAQDLRQEALDRLAAGLDIDPAIVKGAASLNHWTAYQVDTGFIVKHVRPTGELLADFLTVSYLRPMLEVYEDMTEEEARLYRVVFDPSPIMARTDEATSARVLHEIGVLKVKTLLAANGFDDSDLPDDDEYNKWFARKVLLAAPSLGPVLAGLAGLPPDLPWDKMNPPAPAVPGAAPGTGNLPPAGRALTPISDAQSGMQEPPNPGFSALTSRVAVSADAAVDRAFEVAGSRLVRKADKDLSLRDRLVSTPKGQMCTLVRPTELAALGLTPSKLFDGAWNTLRSRTQSWVRHYLETTGVAPREADEVGALAATTVATELEAYVTDRLHRGLAPTSNGLVVPEPLIANALQAAGVR
jgi:hypothetical protein